jgi:small subunit ribosomal protein S6
MKDYELTVLVNPDLESNMESPLSEIRKLISDNGGNIKKEDVWGKKRLAYKITKQDFAVYVFFELELPATAPLKISNVLNISDKVLRYLLVKADKKALKNSEEEK